MKYRSAFGRAMVAMLVFVLDLHPSARADEILYYVKNGQVVYTNTPSRRDVRPVPVLAQRARAARENLPATPYDRFFEQVASREGLDPDLIKAVAMVESGLDPEAVSPKGAMGLMQLIPATASRYGVKNLLDPYESISAGSRHLRDLLDEFGGDLTLALAAYNAGAGAVRRHGGVPAFRETREYVQKVQTKLGGSMHRRRPSSGGEQSADPIVVRTRPDGSVVLAN